MEYRHPFCSRRKLPSSHHSWRAPPSIMYPRGQVSGHGRPLVRPGLHPSRILLRDVLVPYRVPTYVCRCAFLFTKIYSTKRTGGLDGSRSFFFAAGITFFFFFFVTRCRVLSTREFVTGEISIPYSAAPPARQRHGELATDSPDPRKITVGWSPRLRVRESKFPVVGRSESVAHPRRRALT